MSSAISRVANSLGRGLGVVRSSPRTLKVNSGTSPLFKFGVVQKRFSIRDRYTYPKTPQEVEAEKLQAEEEAKRKEAKVLAEQKRLETENKRRWRRGAGLRIRSAGDDVTSFDFNLDFDQPKDAKTLTVALVGAPNAGKSTLVNRLVGQKISIVSPKSQTTREQVLGIVTKGSTQITFIDTPGIVTVDNRKKVDRDIVITAWHALDEAEVVGVIVDAVKTIDQELKNFFKALLHWKKKKQENGEEMPPVVLILNKVDLADPSKPIVDRFRFHFQSFDDIFDKIVLISALEGDGVGDLSTYFEGLAKEGMWTVDEKVKTMQTPLKLVSEVIREKIFRHTNAEIPYGVWQENTGWTEMPDGSLRIDQNLIVIRDSHKGILLGKGGSVIGAISFEARRDLTNLFQRKVHLILTIQCRNKPPETSISEPLVA